MNEIPMNWLDWILRSTQIARGICKQPTPHGRWNYAKTEHSVGEGGKKETRKMCKNGTENATQKYKSIWNWYFKIRKEGFVCIHVSYSILRNCCDLERNNFQFVSDWTNFKIVFDLENDVGEVCTTHKLIVASVWGVFFFFLHLKNSIDFDYFEQIWALWFNRKFSGYLIACKQFIWFVQMWNNLRKSTFLFLFRIERNYSKNKQYSIKRQRYGWWSHAIENNRICSKIFNKLS